MPRRPPLLTRGVRARPPRPPGPTFRAPILCLACGHRWEATWRDPPERFTCPACCRREGVRDIPDTATD